MVDERAIEELVSQFNKMHHGNPIRTIWSLVDSMKKNYDEGNNEEAELYYEAIVSVIKDKLASE